MSRDEEPAGKRFSRPRATRATTRRATGWGLWGFTLQYDGVGRLKTVDNAATVADEGRHVADANAWLGTHCTGCSTDLNHYFREQRAWYVSSVIAEALGMKNFAPKGGGPEYQVWNRGWKAPDVQTLRSTGISNILKNLYMAAPSDTNAYSSEHTHRP